VAKLLTLVIAKQEETVSPSLKTGAFLKVLLRIYDTNVINSIILKYTYSHLSVRPVAA